MLFIPSQTDCLVQYTLSKRYLKLSSFTIFPGNVYYFYPTELTRLSNPPVVVSSHTPFNSEMISGSVSCSISTMFPPSSINTWDIHPGPCPCNTASPPVSHRGRYKLGVPLKAVQKRHDPSWIQYSSPLPYPRLHQTEALRTSLWSWLLGAYRSVCVSL